MATNEVKKAGEVSVKSPSNAAVARDYLTESITFSSTAEGSAFWNAVYKFLDAIARGVQAHADLPKIPAPSYVQKDPTKEVDVRVKVDTYRSRMAAIKAKAKEAA